MTRGRREPDRGAGLMLPAQVAEVIRDLARWALLTAIGAAAACASHHDEDASRAVPPPQTSGSPMTSTPEPNPAIGMAGASAAGQAPEVPAEAPEEWQTICEPIRPRLLEHMKLTNSPDYAAYYRVVESSDTSSAPPSVQMWQQSGTPCATATDASACDAALEAARDPGADCTERGECRPFLLTTAGDLVTRTEDRAAMVALIGVIDNRWKAALLAAIDGYDVDCPRELTVLRGTETKQTERGFDVRNGWDQCGEGLFHQTLHVSAAGTITADDPERFAPSECRF